jgi:3-hydroxyacyl-CoA dehydrogenase
MPREIKKAAVIGAGIMGSGIAAHLAGAGIPCMLLDIVPFEFTEDDKKKGLTEENPKFRNKFALSALENLKTSKPSLIFSKRDLKKITPGNIEDDLAKITDCDWIVEVVVERLDIKKKVFEQIERFRKPGSVVSSNTSGIPLADMAEGRSDDFVKNFIITHFFNPVRYMKLLEVVSGPQNDANTVKEMVEFFENTLGKGVVYAKDTPNFVANRIGVLGFMATMKHILEGNYKVEEVDKIMGPATGRPKTAMFRTADLVGLDTLAHVSQNTYDVCTKDEQREAFQLPDVMVNMVEKKMLGNKTKGGFYKMSKTPEGNREISVLDLQTGEYRPKEDVKYESLKAVKKIKGVGERVKFMVNAKDRAGELAWKAISDTIVYAANRVPEISDDVLNVDNGMRWGFNWDIGPFETWDALGVQDTADRLKAEGREVPAIVQQLLDKGYDSFYKRENSQSSYFDINKSDYVPFPDKPTHISLKTLKEQKRVVKKNPSAGLYDIGDGVFCLEFRSKMNAIDDEIIKLGNEAIDKVEKEGAGLVIHNEGQNFSVGANLMLLWLEAQQKNWGAIEKIIREFQALNLRLRYCNKPVVAAPFNMALGGGCEIALGADQVRAHAETYIGLVEVGVGLIPGGGGCKEYLIRQEERARAKNKNFPMGYWWYKAPDGGPFPKTQEAFQAIAFAKVATSAKEAQDFGILRSTDRISLLRDRVLYDAKQDVIELSKNYDPGQPREDISVAGRGGMAALKSAVEGFKLQGLVSDHDAVVVEALGRILTGGDRVGPALVTEQDILDLECEVFLGLCGMEKTQERIQYMLTQGKPLRN